MCNLFCIFGEFENHLQFNFFVVIFHYCLRMRFRWTAITGLLSLLFDKLITDTDAFYSKQCASLYSSANIVVTKIIIRYPNTRNILLRVDLSYFMIKNTYNRDVIFVHTCLHLLANSLASSHMIWGVGWGLGTTGYYIINEVEYICICHQFIFKSFYCNTSFLHHELNQVSLN